MFIEKIRGGVQCTTCKNYAITYIQHLQDQHADDPEWFFESWDGSEKGLYYCKTCNYNDYISDSEVMSVLFDGASPEDFDDEPIDDLTAAIVTKLNNDKKISSDQEPKYHLIDLERSIGHGIITYWNQNCHGYTDAIEHAGIFSKRDAESIVKGDIDELTVMISTKKIRDILI
jgi:DNA-directed RNA polymerase subunit M/transcription elongation factor TFIIS